MNATPARWGNFFCTVDPEQERIRCRYTDRAMYQHEFRLICQAQRALISEELEEKLYQALFFQRKLKSCQGLIGKCRIYPTEKRCSYVREEAQLFRLYTMVTHLRIAEGNDVRELTEEERQNVVAVLNGYSDQLTQRGTITLKKLGTAIGLKRGEKFTLSDEEKEIYGNERHAQLFRVFGERAAKLSIEEQDKFYHDLDSIEKDRVLEHRLSTYWGLNALQCETAMKLALPDGYCAYSLKALQEILPDLMAFIPLNTIEKSNHPQVGKVWDELPLFDGDVCNIDLRNPVVHRVLTELRRVVNAVIARYGKPDVIRIELARSLKSSNKEREQTTRQMRDREKQRQQIAEKIAREAGLEKPSRSDILKVMLAEECSFTCPYTGKHFSMRDLLYGKDIHIEHIIPYSRSFDDSFRNKTLCEASANAKKNNQTPFEAYSGTEYQDILQRVKAFSGPYKEYKLALFQKEKVDEQEFLSRNLNDTRYASKVAMKYLAMLYGGMVDASGKQRIFATSGGHTALIRRAWGGNYLLGEGEKVRSDHRHHAIDALTIALTTPELVRYIAGLPTERRREMNLTKRPWMDSGLFRQAKEMLDAAAVSHHVTNRLRGALHKETFYGRDFGNGVRHVRMALSELKAEQLPDIVDAAVKKLIVQKIGKLEEEITDKDFAIFKQEENLPKFVDGQNKPVNTIRCVRVAKTFNTRAIGSGDARREVANGANYVLAIFAKLNEAGEEIGWEGEIVSLLDAKLRRQKGVPLFEKERPGLRFKFSLQKGNFVSWEKDGQTRLCIVRGISLPQFSLAPIQDARMQKELKAAGCWYTPTLSAAYAGKMKKYTMNLFGDLVPAND